MTAVSTTHRTHEGVPLEGPFSFTPSDIPHVNRVFSESFTERYQRDGLTGVRVPALSEMIWRYAIADANGGAMLWRNGDGGVAAFNIAHRSGIEGWMGPLAVATESQGRGVGKIVVGTAVGWLRDAGCRVIGLETMPRTMDNIGFYSRAGFDPDHLTVTIALDASTAESPPLLMSRMRPSEQDDEIARCGRLLAAMLPGYDYSREIRLTEEYRLGDTLLFNRKHDLNGFVICHNAPLVEGRGREELRVLKLVASGAADLAGIVSGVLDHARRSGIPRVSFRVQSGYAELYRLLIQMGGKVRWTDLRMTASGFGERMPDHGVVLSNWEI